MPAMIFKQLFSAAAWALAAKVAYKLLPILLGGIALLAAVGYGLWKLYELLVASMGPETASTIAAVAILIVMLVSACGLCLLLLFRKAIKSLRGR